MSQLGPLDVSWLVACGLGSPGLKLENAWFRNRDVVSLYFPHHIQAGKLTRSAYSHVRFCYADSVLFVDDVHLKITQLKHTSFLQWNKPKIYPLENPRKHVHNRKTLDFHAYTLACIYSTA